jgi:hypothetical protein
MLVTTFKTTARPGDLNPGKYVKFEWRYHFHPCSWENSLHPLLSLPFSLLLAITLQLQCWANWRDSVEMNVFWDVTLWGLVEVYRRFRGAYCLHYQGATSQKSNLFYSPPWEPEMSRDSVTCTEDGVSQCRAKLFTVRKETTLCRPNNKRNNFAVPSKTIIRSNVSTVWQLSLP